MSAWKEALTGAVVSAEEAFDNLRMSLRKRLGMTDPVQVCTYRSYGNTHELHIMGRVMEDTKVRPTTDRDSTWRNILNMYRRFNTREVPDAKVCINFQGRIYHTTTDTDGYFYLDITTPDAFDSNKVWQEAVVEVVEAPISLKKRALNRAPVMFPPRNARYGIISDIDDTVVYSFATNKLKMARTAFTKNPMTRLPFEGVAAFYQALANAPDGHAVNPFFYVSSSPWNLYDFLVEFMRVNHIPHGPLLLRDAGLDKQKLFSKGHMAHKMSNITRIMEAYPELNFILIGDSGQKDAAIYAETVRRFPGRVIVTYIRDVKLERRARAVLELADRMKASGEVDMVLVADTQMAAEHAIGMGLIPQEAWEGIHTAVVADAGVKAMHDGVAGKQSAEEALQEIRKEIKDELPTDNLGQ